MPPDEMKYVVLHNNPEGLVMSQLQRDLLFATGNVVDVVECSLHSLQCEFFARVTRRPLMLVLWGMADRYDVATEAGVEVVEVDCWGDASNYCKHLRPTVERWTDEKGGKHDWTVWRKPPPPEAVPAEMTTAQRRSQSAKDGWVIRRAKERKKRLAMQSEQGSSDAAG